MAEKILDPFFNIPHKKLPVNEQVLFPTNIRELAVGSGGKTFKADQQGIWLGSTRFVGAPFQVDMEGNILVRTQTGAAILIDGKNNIIKFLNASNDVLLSLNGANQRISVGANNEIIIDGITKKITVGVDARIEIDGDNQRILMKDSSDVNRIVLDSKNGTFKLSQASQNVLTAGDDKLIWSSDFNMFKIVGSGTIAVSAPGSQEQTKVDVTHGLGYTPSFLMFVNSQGGGERQTVFGSQLWIGGGEWALIYRGWASSTKITAEIFVDSTWSGYTNPYSADFRYYLIREVSTV